MGIITEQVDLPPASPKSFHPAVVSPTHEYHDDVSPTSKFKTSKSSGLALSLRRVTPDRFKHDDGSSFVSRFTGKSACTGTTPVMRGAGNNRSKSPGGGIERQQKMEDEYYTGPKEEEEQLDDGELPSLSRVPSNASGGRNGRMASVYPSPRHRTVNAYWNQDEEESIKKGPARYHEAEVLAAAAAAKTAAAKASPPRKKSGMDEAEFETLKVAGFWSQLDDVSTEEISYEDETEGKLHTVHYNGYEEEPDDERQWRRSQSPVKSRGWATHGPNHHDAGSADNTEQDTATRDTPSQTMADSRTTTKPPKSNWNLLEKAACFAQENAPEDDEVEDMHTVDQSEGASDNNSRQSLDHTYQTSASQTNGATTRDSNTATTKDNTQKEEKDMFSCITDALGAICGYSTYISEPAAPSSAEKKEQAMAIIERDRQRRGEGEVTDDDDAQSEWEDIGDDEREDAAIELEYLSRDGPPEEAMENAQLMSNVNPMGSNTVVTSVAVVGAAGLVVTAATSNAAYEEPQERALQTEPLSPTSEKKKRLTVKSVKNLLGLRKKKEIVNEETPTLADAMGKAQAEPEEASKGSGGGSQALLAAGVAGAVALTSKGEVDDDDMPEMMDADDDSVFTENKEEMEEQDAEGTIQEDSTAGGLNRYQPQEKSKARSIFDEEELESQAAGWDSNRKNSYLRELAQRAKQEYALKKSAEHPDPDLITPAGGSMGASAMGDAAKAAVMADERSTASSRASRDIKQSATAEMKSSQNIDYSSFNPLEKRKFLRLLNSGMSPQEATRSIVEERGDMPTLEDADEVEEDYDDEDEGDYDPPGDTLGGGSGESAELSTKEQDVSRSEKATAGGTSHDSHLLAVGVAGVAAVAAVPAIVRAKSKARQSPVQQYNDEDYNDGHQQEEAYQRGADGFISAGDSYYDSVQRPSYEQDDVDNTFLLSPEKSNARGKKKLSKGLSVSTGFAKVASRRSLESPRTGSGKFTSVNGGSAAHQHFSHANGGRLISVKSDDDSIEDGIMSPRSEASTSSRQSKFNFLHRNTRSKWSKLGSNLDSDVQESRTIEDEEKDFYSPRSAPVQSEGTYSPMSPSVKDVYPPTTVPDEEEEENYLPRSLHVQAQQPMSPFSHPGDEITPRETYPVHSAPVYESCAVQSPPSTDASHVALPSLLPEPDARERNVVTPTYEMEQNELFSPAQESRANSMFFSPDTTLSPTSPQDLGSPEGTAIEEQPEHDNDDFHPIVSPAAESSNSSNARSTNSSVTRSQASESQKPPTPTSARSKTSHDGTDGHSITDYSLAEQSYLTLGTAWTTASKSSRKRHKGAAGKRLMQAKEAESHAGANSKGWMDSIRDVAAKRHQAWDPEKGWQGYAEPETASNFGETKPIGSLHLARKIPPRKLETVMQSRDISRDTRTAKTVDFPQEWANERKSMIETTQSQVVVAVDNSVNVDETWDASTINTSTDTTTVLHNTHAPARRTKPKQVATAAADKRKGGNAPVKTVGWKESMEAATANMQDKHRQWNYDEGWVESDIPDDISELTKTTLERSPGNDLPRGYQSSPVESMSAASPMHSPVQFLPSVAEELAEAESSSQAEAEEAKDGMQISRGIEEFDATGVGGEYEDRGSGAESPSGNYLGIHVFEDSMYQDAPVEDSDKENELSIVPSEDSESASPRLVTEEFPLTPTRQAESENFRPLDSEKPPLPKKNLNQWFEKSQKDGVKSPDVDSAHAVNSRETSVGESSELSQRSRSLYSALDDVKVDETETHEIHVVRERCDEEDRNLFENDISDIQLDSSHSRSNLVMESFETANSSDNEWLETSSPKEKDLNEIDDTTVSSRALAWMSQMEKKANSPSSYSQSRAVFSARADPPRASDPPQNLDPPSIVSDRTTKRIIATRYSSGSISNQTPTVSNQQSTPLEAPRKSRVEELISKLENPDKRKQSSLSVEQEEHPVIFHSNAMGIRLKRGEDGLVRVVSVTESSPGSSIVRDGKIEPDDIVREAAGADLRSPISNSQWGEIVLQIRNASRPMKFVIVSARKSSQSETARLATSQPQHTSSRSYSQSQRSAQQKPPKILFGDDDSTAGSVDDDSSAKQSLLSRISKCAAPPAPKEKAEGNEVPLAHLAFLRTNPTIARVRNEASRRYPALCGRPDTIFEEPEDAEAQGRTLNNSLERSADTSSFDASAAPISGSQPTSRSYVSSGSSASGDNVAYLEGLAAKAALSNKSYRSRNNNSQKFRQISTGRSSPTGSNEVEWPDSDGQMYSREPDTLSAYNARSQSSFQNIKRDTARQAELLAESKVVAMMEQELHYVDSAEECEI